VGVVETDMWSKVPRLLQDHPGRSTCGRTRDDCKVGSALVSKEYCETASASQEFGGLDIQPEGSNRCFRHRRKPSQFSGSRQNRRNIWHTEPI